MQANNTYILYITANAIQVFWPMGFLKIIFFFSLYLLVSETILIHAQNGCRSEYCGSNTLPIRFPFMLQGQGQKCGYPDKDFQLTCSREDVPVLNLPYGGNLSVREINYVMQEIHLYDPNACIPSILIKLNLTSSPFAASSTRNFTFLSCPRGALAAARYVAIECLSNSTAAVVATTSPKAMNVCTTMYTLPIPFSPPADDDGWLSSDLSGDLKLIWTFPDCQGCEVQGGVCGYDLNTTNPKIMCYFHSKKGEQGLQVFKIIALSIVIPAILCSICISCFTCIMERRAAASRRAATAAAPLSPPAPPSPMVGLDESTIESYKKVVVGESKRLPGLNGITCPICLVDYNPRDTLRCIPECQHCFHSDCVDEWLRLNSSCPVCRNSPSR